jgi:hypothetical protein
LLAAAPIFIVAPSHRCGTTLIQRALNSTGRAIIYGENFHLLENIPAIVAQAHTNLALRIERSAEVREQVLAGQDIDASPMYPDFAGLAALYRSFLREMLQYYEDKSRAYGRARWGLKHQIMRLDGFQGFLSLVPNGTYIFVYRNVFDVARSGKARFPSVYQDARSFHELGTTWHAHMETLRAVRGANVLHLEYEEIQSDPETTARRIESHCGVVGIRRDVLQRRINVSATFDRLVGEETLTHYRRPAQLERQELAALMQSAAEASPARPGPRPGS